MSALGFFRKNQKFVFWIMVILMVAFAAGTGIQQLGQWGSSGDDEKIGTALDKPLKNSDLGLAEQDFHILSNDLQLGGTMGVLRTMALGQGLLGEKGYVLLNLNENPRLCWALLLRQADAMGIGVGNQQIEEFLSRQPLNLEKAEQDQLLAALRRENLSKDDLYRAVGNYLRIALAFESAAGQVVQSEPQLRSAYNDSQQELELAMVRLAAEDYVKDVPEPTDEQIDALYEKARQYVAGAPDNPHPLGFGYRLGDAVQLEYVLLDEQALGDAYEPSEEQILAYWKEHPGEFTKQVPVETQPTVATEPATEADTQPQTQPATEPTTQYEQVTITRLGEARQQIVERLRSEALPDRVERVLRELRRLYEEKARQVGADSALSAAVDEISRKGVKGVSGIVLSHKRYGQPLDRKAFEAEQVLSTARYTGMEAQSLADLAFSVKEFHADKPDYASAIKTGQLSERAISATVGTRQWQMLWRIIRAVPSQVPTTEALSKSIAEAQQNVQKLTDQGNERLLVEARDRLELLTGTRKLVQEDFKTQQAYELAQAKAQELQNRAQSIGLHEAAKEIQKQVEEGYPLPRQGIFANPDRNFQMAQQNAPRFYEFLNDPQNQQNQMLIRMVQQSYPPVLLTMSPYYIAPPMVMGVQPQLWDDFISQAYELAPADPTTQPQPESQPATHPTSAPAPADSLKIIPLPAQRTVHVVQRVKYTPAYEDQYQKQRASLLTVLTQIRLHEMHLKWYSQDDIVDRTGFKWRN